METIQKRQSSSRQRRAVKLPVAKDKGSLFFKNTDFLNADIKPESEPISLSESIDRKSADIGNLINSFNQLRLKIQIKINDSDKLKAGILNISESICEKISQTQHLLEKRRIDICNLDCDIQKAGQAELYARQLATLKTHIENYRTSFGKFEASQEKIIREQIKNSHPKISEMQLEKMVVDIKQQIPDKRVSLSSFQCESQSRVKAEYKIASDLKQEIRKIHEQHLQIKRIYALVSRQQFNQLQQG